MKKTTLFLLSIISVLLFTNKTNAAGNERNGSVEAVIDGVKFDLRSAKNHTAQLSPDGKTVDVSFLGNDVYDKQGKRHVQKLHIEYALNEGATATVKSIFYEFNGQRFYNIPGSGLSNISSLQWSADKKSLTLSGDFMCKVSKSVNEGNLVLGIEGNFDNLKVDAVSSDIAAIEE